MNDIIERLSLRVEGLARLLEKTIKKNSKGMKINIDISCQNTLIKYEKVNDKETFIYNFEAERKNDVDAKQTNKKRKRKRKSLSSCSLSLSPSPSKKKRKLACLKNLDLKGFNDGDFHVIKEENITSYCINKNGDMEKNELLSKINEEEELTEIINDTLYKDGHKNLERSALLSSTINLD